MMGDKSLFPKGKMPGHPPEDYTGSVSDWMVELRKRGLWNGKGWYGDIMIDEEEWLEILEKCEEAKQ